LGSRLSLVVTPEGFPLAYEMLPGNTADQTTLQNFLVKIEKQYGNARRIWVMDRGIPTEETLGQMRASDPPVGYLVGRPKGKLSAPEAKRRRLPCGTTQQSPWAALSRRGQRGRQDSKGRQGKPLRTPAVRQ
jgi:hypothetical protein